MTNEVAETDLAFVTAETAAAMLAQRAINQKLAGHQHRMRDAMWQVMRVAHDIRHFMQEYGNVVDVKIDPKFVRQLKNVTREMWKVHQILHLDSDEERARIVVAAERAAKRRGEGRDFEALDYGMGLVDCELRVEPSCCEPPFERERRA